MRFYRLIFITAILTQSTILAAATTTLSIATIIPEGTDGANALQEFAKSVAKDTNGDVVLKFVFGGTAGTDPDVKSQIKDGKLQGAMFAGQIMDQIAPKVRQGEVPFQFGSDRAKARAWIAKQSSKWDIDIEKAGFHNLGFYEAGFVYLISRNALKTIGDFKSSKVWLWPGDRLGKLVIDELKGSSVEVPVQDTFKAFADGRLDAAYAPAIAIVALQWYTKAKNIIKEPISYATGSLLVDQKVWTSLSAANKAKVGALASKSLIALRDAGVRDEVESLDALKSMGVTFNSLPSSEGSKLEKISKSVMARAGE